MKNHHPMKTIIRSCEESSSNEEDYNHTYLSEEVLLEIFIRLPFESIFKFRCVSKFWCSLLNPSFIAKWMRVFNSLIPPPWAVFYKLDLPITNQSFSIASLDHLSSQFISNHHGFSFSFLPEQIYLLASSNGLVLGSTRKPFDSRYYVCNPITKKWILLPPSPKQYSYKLVLPGFICESSSSSLTSRSTYYKVVHIPIFENPSTNFNLEIFTSNTGEWKTHKVKCHREVIIDSPGNVFSLNEVIYWIEGGRGKIIAYDLFKNNNRNGECRLIHLPYEVRGNVYRCLGESEGFISYCHCYRGQLSVWVLEDYFSGGWWDWRLVHRINIEDMLPENCEDRFIDLGFHYSVDMKPLAFNPLDQNVVILSFRDLFVFAYNIKTRSLKLLSRDSFYNSTSTGVFPFVPAYGQRHFDHHIS